MRSPQLVEAVLVWTGWGREMMPRRKDSLVVDRFGAEVAARLLPAVKSLEEEFYASDARYVAADLEELERIAVADFRERHPEVADEIVKALAWCYTFDFR
jgi:hypothetical protein